MPLELEDSTLTMKQIVCSTTLRTLPRSTRSFEDKPKPNPDTIHEASARFRISPLYEVLFAVLLLLLGSRY